MKSLFSILLLLFSFHFAQATSPFKNSDQIKQKLGFTSIYSERNDYGRIKVAVLDQGFYGYQKEIGKTLPSDTKYTQGPLAPPANMQVDHGLKMAQILISLMTNDMQDMQWAPQLTLYNVFGYTNFSAAIDDAIKNKVDVILYSEVWQYGGNNDGKGFINAEVNRAAKAGIVWVNAAGNFALTTYNSSIKTLADDWVQLPDQNNALQIKCEAAKGQQCPIKAVLEWNDFKDDVNLGTNKDLDLALTDDMLNIVETSALIQSADPKETRPGYSKYPREIIETNLKPGVYFLRVKNRSHNFGSQDRLRITVDGDQITMPSHSADESLLNPADNPNVVTVGASDSDRSSTSSRLHKPDIWTDSSILLPNGDEFRGSSNSAAIVAAGMALLKTEHRDWTQAQLLQAVSSSNGDVRSQANGGGGLSLATLGFQPTGSGCFLQDQMQVPWYVMNIINQGAVLVQTSASDRLMTSFDPLQLAPNLQRVRADDMIVVLPNGNISMYPRYGQIPAGAVEIFQTPSDAGLCDDSSGGNTVENSGPNLFRLQ